MIRHDLGSSHFLLANCSKSPPNLLLLDNIDLAFWLLTFYNCRMMRANASVAVHTAKVLLVPYSKHHVPKYHEWLKDPMIREATASEPLTLEEEYKMQESWREDADKLTFIVCRALPDLSDATNTINEGVFDVDEAMIGDVNMFLTAADDEQDDKQDGETRLVGELELMIATKADQNQGFGRNALLTFLRYIVEHEYDITSEYLSAAPATCKPRRLSYLCAKIGEQNLRSIGLFESLGFVKTSTKPTYFGEFELRRENISLATLESLFQQYKIEKYSEIAYESGHGT